MLLAGQAVSFVGDALFPVALAFAVLDELDGTPGELGLVLAAQALPLALLVLVAGVWADRLPRQRLMLVSDFGRMVVQAVVAALLLSGRRRAVDAGRARRRLRGLRGVLPAGRRRARPPGRRPGAPAAGERADGPRAERRARCSGRRSAGCSWSPSGPGAAIGVDAAHASSSAPIFLIRMGSPPAPARGRRRGRLLGRAARRRRRGPPAALDVDVHARADDLPPGRAALRARARPGDRRPRPRRRRAAGP